MFYLWVSKRYQYRQRDEVVNEQFLVEEIYDRELNQAREYESDESLPLSASECQPQFLSDVTSFYGTTD